jgi:o-succinylbenzoate synthase
MRILSVEVDPYWLPFKEPYTTARGQLLRREMVLLRIRDEDGHLGMGEAVPLSMRGGAGIERVVAELQALANRAEVSEAALESPDSGLSAPARCAALTALLDLRGKRAAARDAEPDRREQPIPCNATLVAGAAAAVAADAERWASEGFRTFKLKLGTGEDVEQVGAVRSALGPEAKIRVDANAAWDVATAMRVLSEIEPLQIELAEQPVAGLDELARVAEATAIPIAGDECIESPGEAEEAVRAGACDIAATKLSKVGGPEAAIRIAEVMPSYVSSALDGPVGIAAAAQVAQTLDATAPASAPRFAHGLATQRLFASTIASVECELRDGMLHLPPGPGPGLGVEIDEQALDAHRLDRF